jgi:hypothetical protein
LERVPERKRRIIRQFSARQLNGPLSRFGTRNAVSNAEAALKLHSGKADKYRFALLGYRSKQPEAQIQARSVGQFALYNQGKM